MDAIERAIKNAKQQQNGSKPTIFVSKKPIANSDQSKQTSVSQVKETPSQTDKASDEVNEDIVVPIPRRKKPSPAGEMAKSVEEILFKEMDPAVYMHEVEQYHFNCANIEIRKWASDFSKENKIALGASVPKKEKPSITKSQLIEIGLTAIYYYLEISPDGYKSHQELYDDIIAKMIDFNAEDYTRIYSELMRKKNK